MKIRRKKINGLKVISYGMFFSWFIIFPIFAFFLLIPSCAPKTPEKCFKTATKYNLKKDYQKAYKYYTKTIELNRQHTDAYWERAMVGIQIDSVENSIDDLTMYIELNGTNVKNLYKGYCKRAELMLKKGYKADACDDYNSACELNQGNAPCEQYRLNCKK